MKAIYTRRTVSSKVQNGQLLQFTILQRASGSSLLRYKTSPHGKASAECCLVLFLKNKLNVSIEQEIWSPKLSKFCVNPTYVVTEHEKIPSCEVTWAHHSYLQPRQPCMQHETTQTQFLYELGVSVQRKWNSVEAKATDFSPNEQQRLSTQIPVPPRAPRIVWFACFSVTSLVTQV